MEGTLKTHSEGGRCGRRGAGVETVSGHRESLQELVCPSSNVFQEGGDTALGGETWEREAAD